MKVFYLIIILCIVHAGKVLAQDEITTLKPYFDTKDKQVLLNIDEKTGYIKGVISLKEKWVSKSFSEDSNFLFLVSKKWATKVDLGKFSIVEEKEFYNKPPTEKWDDSDKAIGILNKSANQAGFSSWYEFTYSSKFKIGSNGNVLYLTKSHLYLQKKKELYELKKWKKNELQKFSVGSPEWKNVYDIYNSKFGILIKEEAELRDIYDVHLFNFASQTSKLLFSSGGNFHGKVYKNNYYTYSYKKKKIIFISLQTGEFEIKNAIPSNFSNSYNFDPSSVFIMNYGSNLFAQYNGNKTLLVPFSKEGVLSFEKSILFNNHDEYYNYVNQLYYGSETVFFEVTTKKNNFKAPKKYAPPPAPDRKKMKRKEYKKAHLKWEADLNEGLEKFKREHADYIRKLKQVTYQVFKKKENELILEIKDARMVQIFNKNKILIDRKFELELYDLEKQKTIWITELDF